MFGKRIQPETQEFRSPILCSWTFISMGAIFFCGLSRTRPVGTLIRFCFQHNQSNIVRKPDVLQLGIQKKSLQYVTVYLYDHYCLTGVNSLLRDMEPGNSQCNTSCYYSYRDTVGCATLHGGGINYY